MRTKASSTSFTGDSITASGGRELRYNCPFCPTHGKSSDTNRHLYVHACGGACPKCRGGDRTGRYICHRCGAKGSLRDTKVSLRVPGSLAREYEEAVEKLYDRESTAEPKAALPDGFTKVSHYMKAWDYLLERGLTPSDIKYYGIGVGLQGKVSGRVIVPTFDDFGDVIFWTARSYTDSEIRYINPVGEIRKRALFDISRASREREIVVTEGVFSAMAVGRGAVATFGKLVTNEQVWLLVEAYRREHCGSIAVALDGDARSENHDLARRLTSFGCRVRVVDLPDDRDPADVGREDFSRLLAQAPRFSSLESIRSRAMAL